MDFDISVFGGLFKILFEFYIHDVKCKKKMTKEHMVQNQKDFFQVQLFQMFTPLGPSGQFES